MVLEKEGEGGERNEGKRTAQIIRLKVVVLLILKEVPKGMEVKRFTAVHLQFQLDVQVPDLQECEG